MVGFPAGLAATTAPATVRLMSRAATLARRARGIVSVARPVGEDAGRVCGPGRTGRLLSARGRRRHQVKPTMPAVAIAAATRSAGGSSVTLANGRLAAVSTTVTRIRRITQPGAATTVPTTGGAPMTTTIPPASAASPTAMAGATSGTTTRLTTGDRMASRPNDTRTIGSVAA